MEIKEGYKITGVGVIPEEWNCVQLESVTSKIGSGITPTGGNRIYQRAGIPFVRSQNVQCGEMKLTNIVYIDEVTHKTFEGTEIQYDDVLLNITGASIGRSSVADDAVVGGNVNQHVCILRPIKNVLNSLYLCGYILSAKCKKYIDDFQAGGNREGLNFKQIASIKLPLPPFSEQQAIANTLSDIDALIRSLTKLIEKKKNIKQGAMQELLTGKKRLDGFSGEWVEKELGELGEIATGNTPPTSDRSNYGNEYLFVSPADLGISKYVIKTTKKLSEKGFDISRKFPKGSILFTCIGSTIGKLGIVTIEATSNQQINAIFPNSNYSTDFMYYMLNYLVTQIKLLASEQAVPIINKSTFEKIQITLPDILEQIAISKILSNMDKEIDKLTEKLAKYKNIKQGMMQELLTGRIRLVEGVM